MITPCHYCRGQMHEEGGGFVEAVQHEAVPQRWNTERDWTGTKPKDNLHDFAEVNF